MNVFYNGEIKARKIVGIKNSFMVGQEPNGNYMLEFEDGTSQEVSFEFMDKWSVPKPSLLAGGGLKEGQIIADVDCDGENVETNLVLGYFLEYEDGRNAYVCQKVFDEWYLNVPDYNGEEIDDFYPEDTDSYKGTNEIYNKLVDMDNGNKLVFDEFIGTNRLLSHIKSELEANYDNISTWAEKLERNLDTQLLYLKGQTIMGVVLFILLLISLFN